jgi:hypothetical protein
MRTDHKCLGIFKKLRALPWGSVNDHWNVQINTLASPVFEPSFVAVNSWSCIHNQDKTLFSRVGTNTDSGFQTNKAAPNISTRRLISSMEHLELTWRVVGQPYLVALRRQSEQSITGHSHGLCTDEGPRTGLPCPVWQFHVRKSALAGSKG